MPAVGLVIPTLNAGDPWTLILQAILHQTLRPDRILVVDSASTDATVAKARGAGFEVLQIERSEFNHGATRQRAADLLDDCEIVIFLTQDALPADATAFAHIVAAFADQNVAVTFGRQLPREGATPIEAHAREYNYGAISLAKNLAQVPALGTKVFFCSNSFAAYRRQALVELGGFRANLILGEDMEFAARAVKAGRTVQYCASATVVHSHDYSTIETFRRYFDIGVFDARNGWMREEFGSHQNEGMRFIRSEISYLLKHGATALPRALLNTASKLAGYRIGRIERRLPTSMKRRLSMTRSFWR